MVVQEKIRSTAEIVIFAIHKTGYVHESRKIQLIEEVLKVKNEGTLLELETVLKKSKSSKKKKVSAHDFLGLWSKKDAALIEKAIEDGCEQIHPYDWK